MCTSVGINRTCGIEGTAGPSVRKKEKEQIRAKKNFSYLLALLYNFTGKVFPPFLARENGYDDRLTTYACPSKKKLEGNERAMPCWSTLIVFSQLARQLIYQN